MALTKIPGSLLDTASGINGLIYPTSDGTAGQFLKTDGSGNLTFATVTTYTDSDVETYLDGGSSTPTFASATVSGTLTVTGDLDITGDINSYNVTDLDVTDQTITLGAGQTEANSGGSGIIIDGSSASILWDETNDEFDFNKNVNFAGNIIASDVKAAGAGGLSLQTDEGTKRIFIKDNGDVKVGQLAVGSATTAPLHVAKSSTDCQAIFGDNNSSIDDPSIRIIGRDTANSAIRYTFVGLDADTNYGYIGYNAGSGGFVNALSFNTSGHVGVGIGTSSPSNPLHLLSTQTDFSPSFLIKNSSTANGSVASLRFSAGSSATGFVIGKHSEGHGDANAVFMNQETNAPIAFSTNNTERMRIDSSGNVGITAAASLRFNGAGDESHAVGYDSTVDGSFIRGQNGIRVLTGTGGGTERMRIDSAGTMILRADGAANLGRIQFSSQASTYQILGGNNIGYMGYKTGGYHRFFGSDGAEDMRITANGIILGATQNTPDYPGTFTASRTGNSATTTQNTWGFNATAGGSNLDFGYKASGTGSYAYGVLNAAETAWMSRLDFSGAIHLTNTTVQSISDRRLKKEIVDANSQWNDIKGLQFKNFKWKDEARGSGTYLGLIADEVESVSPGLVGIDAVSAETMPEDGIDPEYKNVKYSILWMKATKALQEAMARIETLEAEVTALKG